MKINEFIEKFVEELEIESEVLTINTNFKDLDEWDSLTALTLLGLVSNEFELSLTLDELESLNTIDDLTRKIGINNFV